MNSELKKLKIFKSRNSFNKIKRTSNNSYLTIFLLIVLILSNIFFYYQYRNEIKKLLENLEKIGIKENIYSNKNNVLNEITPNKHKNNLDESIKLLKIIQNNDENKYKDSVDCLLNDPDAQLCIYHLLATKDILGKKRILLGPKSDGSYVIYDDFENIKYAYSFGISNIIQFDKLLADRGINIYMYDHTINSLPYNNPKFHWKKIGLGGIKEKSDYIKTLEELIKENGHTYEDNMILKIDIEGAEWNSLVDTHEETFSKFKYILIEFHFKNNIENKLYYDVLNKLHKTHQAFYLHCLNTGNLYKFGKNIICPFLEVSYIIKKGNNFIKDNSIYPIPEFDYKISPNKPKSEMNLNIFKAFDN